jgi:hypothetical protein
MNAASWHPASVEAIASFRPGCASEMSPPSGLEPFAVYANSTLWQIELTQTLVPERDFLEQIGHSRFRKVKSSTMPARSTDVVVSLRIVRLGSAGIRGLPRHRTCGCHPRPTTTGR